MERNRLIAEFMGFKESFVNNYKGVPYDYDLPNDFELIKETETTIESNWCEILMEQDECMVEDLKFHTSWDWLMPVISKIYDTAEGEQGREEDLIGNITHSLLDVDFDETYKTVVEFIKWYKTN